MLEYLQFDRTDPDGLDAVATMLEKLVKELRLQAHLARDRADREARERERINNHKARVDQACHLCAGMLNEGHDLHWAAKQADARFNLPAGTVAVVWPIWNRRQVNARRRRLEHEIMRHYRRGLTDPEIAEQVGRHPKTVAKIRRSVLRA